MKHPNEGARLLALALIKEQLTHREVQREIGGSIYRYLSEGRVPDLLRAHRMAKRFGIPMTAWLESPGAKAKNVPSRQNGQTTRQGARA